MMQRRKEGFVIIAVLAMIAFLFFLFGRIIRTVNVHSFFIKTDLAKKQARQFCQNGVSLALSRLLLAEEGVSSYESKEKPQEGADSNLSKQEALRSFYSVLLPALGEWQKYPLTFQADGIDADLRVCLTCEDGKINLNKMMDFEKKEICEPYKKLFAKFKLKNINEHEGDLTKIITEQLRQEEEKRVRFEDVSQIALGRKVEHFYSPFESEKSESDDHIQLADLFTLWGSGEVNPLVMSRSLQRVVGLPEVSSVEKKELFERIYSELDDSWPKEKWKTKTKEIKSLYRLEASSSGKGESSNSEFDSVQQFFSSEIEPKVLSVLSCAEVNGAYEKLLVIVQRETIAEKIVKIKTNGENKPALAAKESEAKKSGKTKKQYFFIPAGFEVVRLYWL
jgi:hypothetical protein